MRLTWQEFEEDLLRREPQPATKTVSKAVPWKFWDCTFLGFAVGTLLGTLIVWIGNWRA